MDLNALEDFQLVASHGGFGKASRATGRSKATLSRRVADLEETLGVRLIERGAHRLMLTQAGEALASRTQGPMQEVAEAVNAARDGVAAPRGVLRLAVPQLFSQLALGRLAARFIARYPEVQIEAVSEDRKVNLVEEHFDVAIRINPEADSQLVGRCFAHDRMVIAAAPSVPVPKGRVAKGKAGEPVRVPAVVMPTWREGDVWSAREGKLSLLPQPVLRLSSLLSIRDAITAGAGVAMVPQSIVGGLLARGELVAWGTAGADVEMWVLHTSRRLESPKVRAFVDFMAGEYPDGIFSVGQ